MAAWRSMAVGLLAGLSCITPRGFPCERDEQCVLDRVEGRCELEQYCSYPDDDCDGGYRFEARAPAGLAGRCVEPALGTSGSGGSSTDASSSGPDPSLMCNERPCMATRLVVGDVHGCVHDGEDTLWCWGSNGSGQLGPGTTSLAERCPGPTVELGMLTQASAAEHMCALDERASVFCWGNNSHGQADWHVDDEIVSTPRNVVELGVVPEVLDVGPRLSCVGSGIEVVCWGQVDPSPFSVELDADVLVLATGEQHACAVDVDGAVSCVGTNTFGQLGNGAAGTGAIEGSQPIQADAELVDAGHDHTCAVVSPAGLDAEVRCWGANDAGQSGGPVGSDTEILVSPTTVSNLEPGPYRALALGASHSCVLVGDYRVQCWGRNTEGQVGPRAPDGFGAHVVELEEGQPLAAVEIGAGASHTCARTAAGQVVCWGDNGLLQLGAAASEATRTYHWLEIGCG
jgi:alpha-tubulin suppressor-like RCC1 family protein